MKQKKLNCILCWIVFGFVAIQQPLAQCNADWIYEDDALTITFVNQSTSQAGDPITSYFWDFGDGATSTVENPVHTYAEPDEYQACLTITTQNGCTDQFCFLVEHCLLTIDATVGEDCDQNNEITLDFTIQDVYDQARDINIFLDGVVVPGSPFEIRDDMPVTLSLKVPGDGQLHVLSVESINIGHCTAVFEFTTFDCASGCFLNNMSVSLAGGITHTVDIGDNFFSPQNLTIDIGDLVQFNWLAGGHSTTSDATSGPDAWNSGLLNAGATYDLILTNPGVHPYYCIPHGGPGGSGMSGQIIANCPPSGAFDVFISFNTGVANPSGYNLLVDGVIQPGSPFQYTGTGQNTLTVPLAGDGANHEITIQDVNDPTCSSTRMFLAPDCGSAPTCAVSVTASQTGGCNASMQVPVQLSVSSINGGAGGFNVLVDGLQAAGPVNYDATGTTLIDIFIAGDGLSHAIVVQDIDNADCNGTTNLTTQDCSVNCQLTNLVLNSGSSFIHTVEVQDFQFAPQQISITSGDVVEFVWTGQVAHTSTSDAATGPDSWDSGLLNTGATFTTPVLSEGVHPYYCIPHGGPGGVGMSGTIIVQANCTDGQVSVQGSFNETGAGFSGYDILVDGVPVAGSPFPYAAGGVNDFSVPVAGDGLSHTIEVRDADNPACSVSSTIVTPDCNASACQLTVSASETGGCVDNQVTVSVQVNDIGGGASGFMLSLDGVSLGSFSYDAGGTTTTAITVAGDGQAHTIEVVDIADPACSATTTITTTDCTIPCALTGLALSTGMASTHTVEVADFEFIPQQISITSGDVVEFVWTGQVAHTSTSDATTGPDSWDSGLLSNGATFTTPVLSEGVHPYYCIPHGAPGGVGMAGTISVLADCNNGQVTVQLTFNESGGGSGGYELLVDGVVSGNAMPYGPGGTNSANVQVPGDGLGHSIEVRDADNPSCSVSGTIVTPDCNATACQLSVNAEVSSGCDGDGNVGVQLSISDVGGGTAGFNVSIDGNPWTGNPVQYDPSGLTSILISMPGDGQAHTISVQDIIDGTCLNGTSISLPDCSQGCQLFNVSVDLGSAAVHTVEVQDFQFSPQSVTVGVGDTVRFVWTGQVAHTSTSDATSGPDSWDSGLLGNGAVFDVVITEAGIHPYYCIPHGAPGGVGMAGTITALADCDNGNVQGVLTFQNGGAAGSGFNVFIDGNPVAGNPFAYADGMSQVVNIPLPGDGTSHIILIQDLDDGGCSASATVTTPDCNASTCQLQMNAIITGPCDGDMNVPAEIQVLSSGAGSGFNLVVDGIIDPGSPYAYAPNDTTQVSIILPGNGQQHTIFIFDAGDVSCTASATLSTPNCAQSCAISGIEVFLNQEPLTHIVEVQDFEYSPKDLTITLGDTVRFVWTGVVAHTTTSDAESGPDSWDSGLLGQNSTFDVVIQTAGTHPYYCVPHGAPGGIGMAGTITATEPCVDQMFPGIICFQHEGTSPGGFDILVDAAVQPGGPFSYETDGSTCISLLLPADGMNHAFRIRDAGLPDCTSDAIIFTPDCTDPCFGFESDFSWTIDQINLSVSFQNQSSIEADSFSWHFGDGTSSSLQDPVHTYAGTGTYTVCMEAFIAGVCSDVSCAEIFVGEQVCAPAFVFEPNGLSVNFNNTSLSTDSIVNYQWTLGDGTVITNEQQFVHTYQELGIYTVCLTIQGGLCNETVCQQVDLSSACNLLAADFNVTIEGTTVQFQDQSTGNVNSWLWGFGDGATSTMTNPTHVYDGPGQYSVCLLVFDLANNCSDFKCIDISIVSTSVAGFESRPLVVYPNPAAGNRTGITIVGVEDFRPEHGHEMYLTDMTGRMIDVQVFEADSGKLTLSWSRPLVPGAYLIRMKTKDRMYSGKLIIQ